MKLCPHLFLAVIFVHFISFKIENLVRLVVIFLMIKKIDVLEDLESDCFVVRDLSHKYLGYFDERNEADWKY